MSRYEPSTIDYKEENYTGLQLPESLEAYMQCRSTEKKNQTRRAFSRVQ